MKTTPIIVGILLLIVVGVGIYFASGNGTTNMNTSTGTDVNITGSPTGSDTNSLSNSSSTTINAKEVEVDIRNFAFSPTPLKIQKGTTVTWTNYDTVQHTVTSATGNANILNSPKLSTGQTFSFTFTSAGTYNYYCTIHPRMKASVVVSE